MGQARPKVEHVQVSHIFIHPTSLTFPKAKSSTEEHITPSPTLPSGWLWATLVIRPSNES